MKIISKMNLLTTNLYEEILIEPLKKGADSLKIVSGFASPAMASKHITDIREDFKIDDINIELIYGMSRLNGLELTTHKGFIEVQEKRFKGIFSCFYSIQDRPIHAKVYTWLKNGIPLISYSGSANYTQTGFGEFQIEALSQVNPQEGLDFFRSVKESCIDCTEEYQAKENGITIFQSDEKITESGLDELELSLLQRGDKIGDLSGLNWGQREGRDRNQAYIPISKGKRNIGFFPKRGEHFTVYTDDNFSFIAVIAQEGNKALHSTENNAILGKYFRKRLGLKDGEFVTKNHLELYGATSVKFFKIDDETYIMDFSPSSDLEEKEETI